MHASCAVPHNDDFKATMKNRHFTTLLSALLFSATVSLQAGYAAVQAPDAAPQTAQESSADLGPHKNQVDRQKGDVDKRKRGDVDKKKPRAKDKKRKQDNQRGKDKPHKDGVDQAQLKQTLMKLKLKKALLQHRLESQSSVRSADRGQRGLQRGLDRGADPSAGKGLDRGLRGADRGQQRGARFEGRDMGGQRQALRGGNEAPQAGLRFQPQGNLGQRAERGERQAQLKTLRERLTQRGWQPSQRRSAR